MKIKHKLFVFIFIGAAVTSLLGLLFVQKSQMLYEQLIYTETTDKFFMFSQRIEEKLKEIEKLSLTIMKDPEVQQQLRTIQASEGSYEAFQAASSLKQSLLMYQQSIAGVSSILIVDESGGRNSVGVLPSQFDEQQLTELEALAYKNEGAHAWIGSSTQNNLLISNREIKELNQFSLKPLGMLLITIQASDAVYASVAEKHKYGSELLIQDGETIIYQELSQKKLSSLYTDGGDDYSVVSLEGEKYLAAYFKLDYTGWTFVHLIPYGAIFENVSVMKGILIVLYVLVLILLLWLGWSYSRSITRSLEQLSRKMLNLEKGDFETVSSGTEPIRDEIGLLSRNFDKMTDRLNTLINDNYVKQMKLNEAKYNMLKAKLNPHFLYNTLDSINWLARMNGQAAISGMVKALGNMLRVTLNTKEMVSLGEEVRHLQNYIAIQQFRFEDRLYYKVNVDSQLQQLQMPSMLLQPIVENCIKYGTDAETGHCNISINAAITGNRLVIAVRDQGPGLFEDWRDKEKAAFTIAESTGIGLHSIDERLKLLYGMGYGIEMEAAPETGTIVHLTLPVIENT
ncbi:sensor histidine kinase [Paenibacillus sinopodophylli]|uniref:sensor histidine kinase n=1 Tax=Paenibacillus sinopodophylli TaxID=1837342 RepID=UPI001FEB910C|nr:histidine kinase [Paenibacillus sinopodophylli]